jgi:hypothetical protein
MDVPAESVIEVAEHPERVTDLRFVHKSTYLRFISPDSLVLRHNGSWVRQGASIVELKGG